MPSNSDVRDRPLLRGLVAACQAMSVILTWPLWQVRSGAAMPNLPVFDSALLDRPQVPFGEALLFTLAAAIVWPRIGATVHCLVLAAAIGFDQMRIQPEFVSLAILLLGTVAHPRALLLARCHLISLWFWAGLHKLLSPEYLMATGPDLVLGLLPGVTTRQAMILGIGTAAFEMLLGLAAFFPATRRVVPQAAGLLHGMVLLTLVARGWNSAVWPWNLALGAAGFGLFMNWNEPLWPALSLADAPIDSAADRQPVISRLNPVRHFGWQATLVLWMAYPALFYLNLCDGYLAWCVYSANVPEAVIYDSESPDGERVSDRAYRALNVPFSPATRLYEQHFRRTGQVDDRLEIDDPRPLSRWLGQSKRVMYLPDPSAEDRQ
ncbi:MAG: hypothetical protein L0211_27295 [Planctomycetaceae bacterium]|nr:hypothetical protein [Planctomycetaceae bacterium]